MSTSDGGWRARLIRWLEERLNLSEIFSFVTTFGLVYDDIDTKRSLAQTVHDAFRRPHPVYVRWPHILDILAFVLFLFQGVTGAFLAFYYQPTPEAAYDSVLTVVRDTHLGWYIHQMHSWGSHLLVVLLLVRLLRFFADRAYRSPRELEWLFGILLLLAGVYASLTGLVLRWDQQAYWSFTRSLEVVRQLPLLGSLFGFLVGGSDVGRFTLPRSYVLHILTFPALMVTLFYLHFATIRRVGLSRHAGHSTPEHPLYPDHILNLLTVLVLLFGVLLTVSVLHPVMTRGIADPYTSYPAPPVWYLLPAYGLMELLPEALAGALVVATLLLLAAVPFIDSGPDVAESRRAVVRVLLVFGIAAAVWLGRVGFVLRG